MIIRKASLKDIDRITEIYEKIHECEENGTYTIGWKRGIYPTSQTALSALERDDIYVIESEGNILASAIINGDQTPEYALGKWRYRAGSDEVLVLHTLTVDPDSQNKGLGKEFVKFYETMGKQMGYKVLRIDTQLKNLSARSFYPKFGFTEAGIVKSEFNGLGTVDLMLYEKLL